MERDLAADVATVQLNVTTLVHLTGVLLPRMLDRTGTESCGELIHIVPAPTSPRSESRIRHQPSHRPDAPAGAGVKPVSHSILAQVPIA